MRVVFFGTPQFAVPTLESLLRRHEVCLVVSQPDRPAGRGLETRPSAVAGHALAAGLEVARPERAREADLLSRVSAATPDVVVVAAYGQILPRPLLDAAPGGAINVHASLLPRWRGASPITAAILAGDEETGVSIMRMDEGLDTGPVLLRRALRIDPRDDAETLSERLAALGAEALLEALEAVDAGTAQATAQPERGVTYAGLVKKSDGHLEWTREAGDIERAVRAYRPWPGVRLPLAGEPVQVVEGAPVPAWWVDRGGDRSPGAIVDVNTEGIVVMTSSTPFLVRRVKPAGKRDMAATEYARGRRDLVATP
ncbi:MAG: methionyl-tRNA formyltransferase [Candidatus Dormibacteria bacterium]